uniref:2'-5' oligoadenylate synthase n=1 Tax=Pelodiscus sinensis TaxID=13735 RepID=K7FCB2_PELSI|nr:2'-5'-oligoadenylate synthase 3-like [Pelodiscus sinensis]|eukprot:XP_006116231.1 2'-5'-oligoadenylate synthase 3-like [Pelodiscus sinensis]
MAVDLYQTPARKLDKFIFDNLQPDCTFLRQAGQAIDTICEFLKTNCFVDQPAPRTKVLKIIKGGSLGKGTSLKGISDADLVVFLSCFKGYDDQERNRAEIIREIRRMLEKCQQQKQFDVIFETSQWSNPRVLSFQLHSKMLNESIDFDVLPAYNALSSSAKPDPQVYEDLIVSYSRGGEFSTCFTELQRDFVVDRYTKVKSLIRLVKHWYKQYVCPHKKYLSKGKEFLPPQYALELLSIYAWERGSKNRGFDMAKGFRTVLELIQQYKQLCVYWTVNYNFADEELAQFLHRQLQKTRPVILDPADPTGIVGEGCRWDLMAMEAEKCCAQQCCVDFYGVPVEPWDVPPVQTHEGSRGFEIHTGAQEPQVSVPQLEPAYISYQARAFQQPREPAYTSSYTGYQDRAFQQPEEQPSFCTVL